MLWMRQLVLWLILGIFRTVENVFSDLLTMAENCHPYVPVLTKEYMEKYFDPSLRTWQHPDSFYFLDDPSPRYCQRLKAVILGRGEEVSYWRKRELHRRIKVLELRICSVPECVPKFRPYREKRED